MPRQYQTPGVREFAAWVKDTRKKRGLTLLEIEQQSVEEFGEEGRLTESYLSKLETGKVDSLPIERATRLGWMLGADPDEVAGMMHLLPQRKKPGRKAEDALRSAPDEFLELASIYNNPKLSDEDRARIRNTIGFIVSGVRATAGAE